ncbi:MAG TPA: serine hydrolase [Candidatus Tyrphobacter sp.]
MRRGRFLGTGLAAAAALTLPKRARAQALEERIHQIAADAPGTFGIFARTMAPGPALFAVNAYDLFPCASTIKLLVMTTAYYWEERRPGTLRERITFDRSRLIGGSDFMQDVRDGARMSVRQLIAPMILVSDNTAANLLIGHFGVDEINAVGYVAGMLDTHLDRQFVDYAFKVRERNVTTPYDMANLLYLVESGAREGITTIVNPAHCRAMIHLLLAQQDRDKIPAALPGIPVANKDGEVDGTRDDVAIVEPFNDSPFILSIYSKGVDDYAACLNTIHRITRLTYDSVAASDL